MTIRRTTLASALAAAAALATAVAAVAANQPGDPCTKAGEIAVLGAGKIQCVGGAWQPYNSGAAGNAEGSPPLGNAPAPAPGSAAPASGASTLKAAAIFTKVGTALTQETFGSTGGQVADATGVRLADGRIRLYAFVSPEGVRSAISTDATGTRFTGEPDRRLSFAPGGQTRAIVLADGRIRLFYTNGGSISSAISTDGLTFTDEGPRITSEQAGFEPGTITVVKFGGGYRGYFSNLEKPGVKADRILRTATSPDMLTWTVGPTITGSAGSIKSGGSHPFAITDGKTIALYYNGDRGGFYGTLRSTSTDGVTFGDERTVLTGAGDPNLIPIPGATLLYYGYKVGASGFGVLVARATASPISGVTGTTAAKAPVKAPAKKPIKVMAPVKKPATTVKR